MANILILNPIKRTAQMILLIFQRRNLKRQFDSSFKFTALSNCGWGRSQHGGVGSQQGPDADPERPNRVFPHSAWTAP